MKFTNNTILKKIILLSILLFGAFFIVWILNSVGLYDFEDRIEYNYFPTPYSILQ